MGATGGMPKDRDVLRLFEALGPDKSLRFFKALCSLCKNPYCQQLDDLKLAIDQKRPELANRRGVVFHQDNDRLHTSVVTHQKLWKLGWEILMHPLYSSDLTSSDYYLFLALQNFLSDKKLGSEKIVKIDC
ncbi:histone-lysine N-methyltransferase SETMAR [Trichonephila clavipes]|nr:histone-lysine N-methyltransferase SETMAR [Trichonephila clavipes]